jgi:hypothetical protein
MDAVHSFGRLTELRSLPTQLSSRRYSAVGGFNGPRAERLCQTKKVPVNL